MFGDSHKTQKIKHIQPKRKKDTDKCPQSLYKYLYKLYHLIYTNHIYSHWSYIIYIKYKYRIKGSEKSKN